MPFSHRIETKPTIELLMVVFAAAYLGGCATAGNMNRLSLGMTKPQVLHVMGDPNSTSANVGKEYLTYRLTDDEQAWWYGIKTDYFVRLIDGKVDSYGRMGDFDSTKTPEVKAVMDVNVKQQ